MTGPTSTGNEAPREGLSAPESAQNPDSGTERRPGGLNGPQTGVQGLHPVRKGLLPCIPPPEWEFHTWFPTPDGGGDLVPGQHQRGVHVRRRVTYGDWEPVHPDRWAPEPAPGPHRGVAAAPTPPQDGPHAPHNAPEWPGAGAETPDGGNGAQAASDALARADATARRFLAQRQEMAAERYAWQERALAAEAALAQAREGEADLGARVIEWVALAKSHQEWGQRRWNAWKSARARANRFRSQLARVRAECDRLEAAVRAHPQTPDFDGAYLAAIRHIRGALDEPAACDHDSQVIDHEGAQYWACLKCGHNLGRVDDFDGGPTVAEAKADDVRWPLRKAGE